jgi:hypothetical protein
LLTALAARVRQGITSTKLAEHGKKPREGIQMAHDREKYSVSWSLPNGETGEVSMSVLIPGWDYYPSTMAEARAIAKHIREHGAFGFAIPAPLKATIEIGRLDDATCESWTRVRRSQKHPDGWKRERK